MYFEWKDNFSVDIEEIDSQHKKMFEIGRRISDLVLAKDDVDHLEEVMVILQELEDYTTFHLKYEEMLMEKYGFHEAESHKIEHAFLVKKLQRLQNKDIDAKQKEAIAELIAFVSDWIAVHILKTDMQYKDFFRDKVME